MDRITDIWKDVLQNLSGKTLTGNYTRIDDLLKAFNNFYVCEVTFSKTPSGANVVVKKGAETINADESGKYHLKEGTYSYDATATHYTSKTNQELVITNADETTGTKTVSVTLSRSECGVSFTLSPETATLVVKDSESHTITAVDGVYWLPAGSYTYTASAEGYTSAEDVSLTISAGDVTTGTKTVEVTLVEA